MQTMTIARTMIDGYQTLGEFYIDDSELTGKTLELPWADNERRVSCIPPGRYLVAKRNSPKYGDHFHITAVDGRSYILIHHGNFRDDILGCILVGDGFTDIDGDGNLDVTNSKAMMAELNKVLDDTFFLDII